jgi:hypothetical protein
MTALPIRAPQPTDLIREPSLRRLLGAAIVGGLGAIVLSVAVAGNVVGSRAGLPAAQAADAHALTAAVPWIVLAGLIHVVVAAALAAGRDAIRIAAAITTGLAAIAAAAAAVMTAAGIDPFGWSGAGHPAATGAGILAVVAVLYGAAALLAGSVSEG